MTDYNTCHTHDITDDDKWEDDAIKHALGQTQNDLDPEDEPEPEPESTNPIISDMECKKLCSNCKIFAHIETMAIH